MKSACGDSLTVLVGVFAVVRLDRDSSIPSWAFCGSLSSVSKTSSELSVVCEEGLVVEAEVTAVERGFRAMQIDGPLDFGLTGVLSSILSCLAQERISVFAISTFDTDYVLVRDSKLALAIDALRRAGKTVATV
jgi:hypothetical protein